MDELKPFTDRIAKLTAELEAERIKVKALEKRIRREPRLQSFEAKPGEATAYIKSQFAPILAEILWGSLEDEKAVNYVEFTVTSPEKGRAAITIQKLAGKTPHQLKVEAEQRAYQAEQDRDSAKAYVVRIMDHLEMAWGVIANAGNGNGNWDVEGPAWKEAAEKWRDEWHKILHEQLGDNTLEVKHP